MMNIAFRIIMPSFATLTIFSAILSSLTFEVASFIRVPIPEGKSRCKELYSRNALSLDQTVELEVMALRASEIKKVLSSLNANTKGLYDKSELGKLLIQLELESLNQSREVVTSVPLFDVSHGDTPIKYVAMDVEINSKKLRFMVDTGATINLIKKSSLNALGLKIDAEPIRTIGLGGSVAASKTTIRNILVGGRTVDIEAAVFDNEAALPNFCSGLIGLRFLSQLGQTAEFDFTNMVFKSGPREKLLSPLQKRKYYEFGIKQLPTGLIGTDIRVNGGSASYSAMIDTGNVHTIANSHAVKAISGSALSSLPPSPIMCEGIDGVAISMRTFMINELKVGEDHILSNALSAYAADVPGMAHIGMGNSPNFILGMDVLRKDKMLLDPGRYKMYMSK